MILMMAWPEKKFSGGGSKFFFSHFRVLFDVDFAMKAKKTGYIQYTLRRMDPED